MYEVSVAHKEGGDCRMERLRSHDDGQILVQGEKGRNFSTDVEV